MFQQRKKDRSYKTKKRVEVTATGLLCGKPDRQIRVELKSSQGTGTGKGTGTQPTAQGRHTYHGGDGVAQWVQRRTREQSKDPRFEPRLRQKHKKKKCCAESLSVCPTECVYARLRMITYVRTLKDHVVHVRVRWITKTRTETHHALYN